MYIFWSHLARFFLEWEMFQMKVLEKVETHFVFSNFYLRKSWLLWHNVEKYFRARQATDDKMAHALCMLNAQGYKYTLRICNTYCSSTAKMVTRTRLSVTLHVQRLYTGSFKMIVRVLTTCLTQYTSFSRCNPMWFLSMGLRQRSVFFF